MLDKSLPYYGIIMLRKPGSEVPVIPLPEGFRFVLYNKGEAADWARIETSVLEFDSEFEALMHFTEKFIPFEDEMCRRCVFIENSDGLKVATATAWWTDVDGLRLSWVNWVAVSPEYQDLGLGKAVISRMLRLMVEIEGDKDIYLHTQTWSHKAVGIYNWFGFRPTGEKALYTDKKNNMRKAMRILKKKGIRFD